MLKALGTKLKVNDISKELKEKLQKKMDATIKINPLVKYRFNIDHWNPDPEKHGGDRLFAATYQLQPVTFYITDGADRGPVKIGLPIDKLDGNGDPDGFSSIFLTARDRGILRLDLRKAPDREKWMYLELHPGNEKGEYFNVEVGKIFWPIDEVGEAKEKMIKRNVRRDAMIVADGMGDQEIVNFALAIGWDAAEPVVILREKVSSLAETNPDFFKEFIESSNFEMRALVAKCEKANIIDWHPAENRYVWSDTQNVIVAFGRTAGVERYSAMADWLLTDTTGKTVADKLKALVKASQVPA